MKQSRNTIAKSKIFELLSKSEEALSHAQIQTELGELCDRVTIYRVLERLANEGGVHKVVNVDGVIKYAFCQNCTIHHQHDHAHFSCQKCKAVTCLEGVHAEFNLPDNYQVEEINFMISGICPTCRS